MSAPTRDADRAAPPSPPPPAARVELAPVDLLLTTPELLGALEDCLADLPRVDPAGWLDATLLAAGIGQLIEDARHDDPAHLRWASEVLARSAGPVAAGAAWVTRAAATVLAVLRRARPAYRRLTAAAAALDPIVRCTATQVVAGGPAPEPEELAAALRALRTHLDRLPARLRSEPMRLPSCFRSFDQHPDDLRALARATTARLTPGTPVVVVGVRTSGSYLAPLLAAALDSLGVPDVSVATVRPGRPLLRAERGRLRDLLAAGARVLLVDDPPTTGGSLAAAAEDLGAAGVPPDRLLVVVATFDPLGALPSRLRGLPAVTLGAAAWAVRARLSPDRVAAAIVDWLPPDRRLLHLRPLAESPVGTRSHVVARYLAELATVDGGEVRSELTVVGTGLGYLGRHAVAVAAALPGRTPAVLGHRDGLLYTLTALTGGLPVRVGPGELRPTAVGEYVAARHLALRVTGDRSRWLTGRLPVWEAAANLLAGQYGRLGPWLRLPLLDPLVRELLAVSAPSIVDGATSEATWWAPAPQDATVSAVRKDDVARRAFSNLDLACYDAGYDLAGACVLAGPAYAAAAQQAFTTRTGELIGAERWLIYLLVHVWDLQRAGRISRPEAERVAARHVQAYLAARYLADLPEPGRIGSDDGPLCAIDVDGVLDTDRLGFPAASPTSVLALRALRMHGYRPVLVSGRSLEEVRDRCRSYGLAGGVAEYGAFVYTSADDRVDELAAAHRGSTVDRLAAVRGAVRRHAPEALLDPAYRGIVRAALPGPRGGRPLGDRVHRAVRAAVPGIVTVVGDGQTDFHCAEIDKGAGLRALAARLGADVPAAVALAVGDGPADRAMFAVAVRSAAPRHADRAVTAGGVARRTRRRYQAGLGEAVADLIGHPVGGCRTCRPPAASRDALLFEPVLRAAEGGGRGLPRQLGRLALVRLRATRRRPPGGVR